MCTCVGGCLHVCLSIWCEEDWKNKRDEFSLPVHIHCEPYGVRPDCHMVVNSISLAS